MQRLLLLLFLLSAVTFLGAQDLVGVDPEKRTVILEEFTGVNCGYCPEGHAIGRQIYEADPFTTVLINLHTGSFANPSGNQPDFRTVFGPAIDDEVGVTGYPAGTVNRHRFVQGEPISAGRGAWFGMAIETRKLDSPVNLGLQSEWDEATRELTVTVELIYTGDSPAASNFLNVAFLENGYIGYQSDYVNGAHQNYEHNQIFRDLLTGQWGEEITTTTSGSTVSKTYKFTVPAEYDIDNCDIAAFVTESRVETYTGQKVSANGGRTNHIGSFVQEDEKQYFTGEPNQTIGNPVTLKNGFHAEETFDLSIDTNAPSDWVAEISLNGTTYTLPTSITLAADQVANAMLNITPGESRGIAEYKVTMSSTSVPEAAPKSYTMYVMNGVSDMVVSNPASDQYSGFYTSGLDLAGNEGFSSTTVDVFSGFSKNADISGVKNIYFNIGWTFPGLSQQSIDFLIPFLEGGGNLLIAGQDIGWDSFDPSGNGTNATRAFFNDYMHTNYLGDGSTANTPVTAVEGDEVFQYVENSSFNNVYGNSIYPEELAPINGAVPVFTYNNNASKVGAIRVETDKYKLVYLGFGLEQMTNINTAAAIMKKAHDWFYGITSGTEEEVQDLEFGIFPNPASDIVNVDLSSFDDAHEISVINIAGQTIVRRNIDAQAQNVSLIANDWEDGLYVITVRNVDGRLLAKGKLSILK